MKGLDSNTSPFYWGISKLFFMWINKVCQMSCSILILLVYVCPKQKTPSAFDLCLHWLWYRGLLSFSVAGGVYCLFWENTMLLIPIIAVIYLSLLRVPMISVTQQKSQSQNSWYFRNPALPWSDTWVVRWLRAWILGRDLRKKILSYIVA